MATTTVATKLGDVKDFNAQTPVAGVTKQPGWTLWFLWVAASIVGFALSASAVRGGGAMISENTPPVIAGTVLILGLLLLPALPAFLHWLILRRLFACTGWWIPASVVGWLLAYIPLNMGIAGADTGQGFLFISERYVFGVACAVAGALAGTLQWLVLRRCVSYAGWWVLASSVSWLGAALVFGYLMKVAKGIEDAHLFLLGAAASGTVSGVITGLALVWLLQTPSSPLTQFPKHKETTDESHAQGF
jgi:hypothetical protein